MIEEKVNYEDIEPNYSAIEEGEFSLPALQVSAPDLSAQKIYFKELNLTFKLPKNHFYFEKLSWIDEYGAMLGIRHHYCSTDGLACTLGADIVYLLSDSPRPVFHVINNEFYKYPQEGQYQLDKLSIVYHERGHLLLRLLGKEGVIEKILRPNFPFLDEIDAKVLDNSEELCDAIGLAAIAALDPPFDRYMFYETITRFCNRAAFIRVVKERFNFKETWPQYCCSSWLLEFGGDFKI